MRRRDRILSCTHTIDTIGKIYQSRRKFFLSHILLLCGSGIPAHTPIRRECEEEIGFFPAHIRLIPLEKFTSPDGGFSYHTFFCCVDREFQPTLNNEHLGYAWIDSTTWPRPMHPGLWNVINIDEIRGKIDLIKNQMSQ